MEDVPDIHGDQLFLYTDILFLLSGNGEQEVSSGEADDSTLR